MSLPDPSDQPSDPAADTPSDDPPSDPSTDAPIGQDDSGIETLPPELGGQKGPEPTRYGDWEKGGRCTDF